MSAYSTKAHSVDAKKITGLAPLLSGSGMMSPNAGLILILTDDSKHKWVGGSKEITPTIGDWLVQDTELNATFVVAAAKFSELFEAA